MPEPEPERGSISRLISGLKAGDEAAARQLWCHYFEGLVQLARGRLREAPSAAADEEDIALSAFKSLCLGATRGHFPSLENRDDLWRLLVTITLRKAFDQLQLERRQKRGGGRVVAEADLGRGSVAPGASELDKFAGPDPGPEFLALVAEQYRALFERLREDSLRQVVRLRMEGYTSQEIAQRLGCTRRTVTRKLEVIRRAWQE